MKPQRNLPLDAYRGFIMLLLVANGFGFASMPKQPFYQAIARQFEHNPWGGAVFEDLIMPAFLFMVGVAMPFSLGRRMEKGEDFRTLLKHVAWRALKLLILGEIFMSIWAKRAHLQFHNVLTQIAAAYFICFLLMRTNRRTQAVTAVLLMVIHSSIYLLFPGPDGPFQPVTNIGAVIDRALMGHNYDWPCVNLNLLCEIPSVLFGVWTGEFLRSGRKLRPQLAVLAIAAAVSFAAGLALSPLVPINKWLWTASYTLYTNGWCLLGLLAFYLLIEAAGIRRPMFPLMVAGMNPLFIYCFGITFYGWLDETLRIFSRGFAFVGTWAPVVQACAVLALIWYISYWLFRRKIFLQA